MAPSNCVSTPWSDVSWSQNNEIVSWKTSSPWDIDIISNSAVAGFGGIPCAGLDNGGPDLWAGYKASVFCYAQQSFWFSCAWKGDFLPGVLNLQSGQVLVRNFLIKFYFSLGNGDLSEPKVFVEIQEFQLSPNWDSFLSSL